MRHVLVDISAHGFGHVAQTAAVLNALDMGDLRLTIRSATPESVLRRRIHQPFTLIPYQQDNGMVMHDALRVDIPASMRWYEAFHTDYAGRKAQAARELEQLQPDLLFANVPYLSLDAAATVGVPAIALCSLNWADIFHAYCSTLPGAAKIHEEILNAYRQAETFLLPAPSMDMHEALRTRAIAPIAAIGQRHPARLRERSGMPDNTRFVLVSLGGVSVAYPLENWPELPGVCWIFPDSTPNMQRADFLPESQFGLAYVDLLASCDLLITKTGYGTQTEAVVNQVPVLCISRPDWPEEPNLPVWHREKGEIAFTDWQQLQTGGFGDKIMHLLETGWTKPAVLPTGAAEAASVLQTRLQSPDHVPIQGKRH
jgi:hypothetical protein